MTPEIHLFILWETARIKECEILDDIKSSFTLLKEYEISWSPTLVASNFSRFYGQNLPDKSFKEKECGRGSFLLIIVRDENPKYEVRNTSHGLEEVNINLFDKKSLYREWTGGGHKVHCTTNEKETNHDLTLLLGKNVEDFLRAHNKSPERETLQRDIEGANGWESIEHLFYVLNNTISYCILRNYESLPKDYDFTIHGDIDLLTENKNNAIYITNATPVHSEQYRVYCNILVGSKYIPFDFRYIGDNYYDKLWEIDILEKRILSNAGFYIPDSYNQYYTLLYHAYVQKYNLAEDYPKKLSYFAAMININYMNDIQYVISQLDEFLDQKGYEYIKCEDKTVGFNQSNLKLSKYYMRYGGPCIRSIHNSAYDKVTNELLQWESRVYEKENSFVKKGTPWLIENERNILSQLNLPFVPKLIASGREGSSSWIEISRVHGEDLDKFLEVRSNFTLENIREIVESGLNRLLQIYLSGIMHRDIIPGNILVSRQGGKLECGIIDFGSSIKYKDNISFPSPYYLGISYAPEYMYSDFYSYGKVVLAICRKMPYLKRIANELSTIQWDNYTDEKFVKEVVERTLILCKKPMTLRDFYAFYRKKYSSWRKYVDSPSLIPKQLLVRTRKFIHRLFQS